jgi:hypothetical protein
MSIKSDKWIRRMAREQRLIDPFEPGQVRESAAGRVISYGTSSYGYDVRCAPEFKIFTNSSSTKRASSISLRICASFRPIHLLSPARSNIFVFRATF